MVAMTLPSDATALAQTSPLKGQVVVGSVTGGSETNPLMASQVDNPGFQGALTASLGKVGLKGPDTGARYTLDANLLSLAQPMMGFDMTVTSTVLYRLTDTQTKTVAFEQHVVTPFTATFGDATIGVERLKMANEGSIRRNIETALSDMLRKVKAAPAAAPGTPTS